MEARQAGAPIDEALVRGWWRDLRSVRLAPVSARGCEAVDDCIGIDLANDDCVCTHQTMIV